MSTICMELDKCEESLSFIKKTEKRMEGISHAAYSRYLLSLDNSKIIAVFRMKFVPRFFLRLTSWIGLRKEGYKGTITKYSNEDLLHYLVLRCHKMKFILG